MLRRFAPIALAFALAAGPAASSAQTPQKKPAKSAQAAPVTKGQRNIICRGAPIPEGWIVANDLRDTTMCDGSNPAAVNSYNVWAIERHDNRPTGTVIEVCASAQTPAGWNLVDVYRNKAGCGHPNDLFTVNVKRIRRVR